MQQFQEERLWCAASTLQSLTNCIQWTVEWAQERKLFGSTLADQQWVQFKLAELKAEVELPARPEPTKPASITSRAKT